MSKKHTASYIVNVKAEYDSVTELVKELNKIQNNNSLGLNRADTKQLELLLLKAKQFQDLVQSRTKGTFNLESADFKGITSDFKSLSNAAEKFSESLIKFFDVDAQAAINKISTQLSILKDANRELGRKKTSATASQNRILNQATADRGLTNSEGGVLKFKELDAMATDAIKQAEVANRELNESEQKIVQIRNEIVAATEEALKPYKDAWQRADTEIQSNIKSIQELNAKQKELSSGSISTTISEESKNTILQYSDVVAKMGEAELDVNQNLQNQKKEALEASTATNKYSNNVKKATDTTNKYNTILGKAVYNVLSYGSALAFVRTASRQFTHTIVEMDKALTGMTVVTSLSREQAWALTGQMQSLAKETGMTTTEVANMTTMYLQQGKTLADSLELTEAAAKAARIAGISGTESINLLTNAMNGFQLSANQAMNVSDKFASLAAAAATDYEELATALSKVAAQANLAGMSMDFTLGLLTKGIEVTREAPETIGTALKTVISRMRELTDYGETLEDGIDVNRVDTALKNIGVSLLDTNREFRNLEDVLTEVGMKWDTLNTNQQANVAVALAGTRQQSRLIAMMQDFDRTLELVNISMNSAGATAAQHAKYMDGLEAATTRLTTSYQQIITSVANSDIAIAVINTLAQGMEILSDNSYILYGIVGLLGSVYAPLIKAKIADVAATVAATFTYAVNKKAIDAEIKSKIESAKIEGKLKNAVNDTTQAKLKAIIVSKLMAEGMDKVAAETAAAEIATQSFNNTLKSNVFILIISAILALVSAWWSMNKETTKGKNIMNSLNKLFKSLEKALHNLMSIVEPVIDGLMWIVDILGNILGPVIQFVANLINSISLGANAILKFVVLIFDSIKQCFEWCADNFPLLGNFVDRITGLFSGWANAVEGALNAMNKWAWTDKQRAKVSDSIITANQTIIYDTQQKKNSVQPLIEEYERLSESAIKTTEDLERMKQIEEELSQTDKEYLDSSGKVRIEYVKNEIAKMSDIIAASLEESYREAINSISYGSFRESFKSAIADYYREEVTKLAELGQVTSSTASKIAESYKSMVDHMSEEDFMNTSEAQFKKMYDSIVQIESEWSTITEDGNELNDTLSNQFEIFEKHYAKLTGQAQEAFASVYSLYAEYSRMIDELHLKGSQKTNFLNNIELLGITESEYESLMQGYIEANNATEDEFRSWFGSIVSTDSQNKSELVTKLMQGQKQEFVNLIDSATVKTNTDILDDYAKSLNKANNLADLSKKAKLGTLTTEELDELYRDNSFLFNDERLLEEFMSGRYTGDDLKTSAYREAVSELETRLAIATQSNDRGQIAYLNRQLEILKYHSLYSSQLWQDLASRSKEESRLLLIEKELEDVEKERSLIEQSDLASTQEKVRLLQKQKDLYDEQYAIAKKFLSEGESGRNYSTLSALGLRQIDGKWVGDTTALQEAFGRNFALNSDYQLLINWADDNAELIEKYSQIIEDYDEVAKQNRDDLISIIQDYADTERDLIDSRKAQYEEYFDAMDALEQTQERSQKRADLIGSIAALSGGIDGNSKQLRKELLQQLQTLNEEEAEARRQEMRDNLLNNMDKHIENIDRMIEIIAKSGYEDAYKQAVAAGIIKNTVPYSNGGLVNYTGLAMVHGSKSKPEAFLNAADTKMIRAFLDNIVSNFDIPDNPSFGSSGSPTAIVIESINIKTEKLNEAQDFGKAGATMAEEFAKTIQAGGININVKK